MIAPLRSLFIAAGLLIFFALNTFVGLETAGIFELICRGILQLVAGTYAVAFIIKIMK